MSEILPNLMFFIRIVLLISFSLSFITKVRDIALFDRAIVNFRLLPQMLNWVFSRIFLFSELAIVVCLVLGGNLLLIGFSLSIILLSIFSVALMSVLARNLHISCNCFGASENRVSIYDVWRNIGLIVFASLGWGTLTLANNHYVTPTLLEGILSGLVAVVFSSIWTHLGDIIHVFRTNSGEHQYGNHSTD